MANWRHALMCLSNWSPGQRFEKIRWPLPCLGYLGWSEGPCRFASKHRFYRNKLWSEARGRTLSASKNWSHWHHFPLRGWYISKDCITIVLCIYIYTLYLNNYIYIIYVYIIIYRCHLTWLWQHMWIQKSHRSKLVAQCQNLGDPWCWGGGI